MLDTLEDMVEGKGAESYGLIEDLGQDPEDEVED
jgi:hypothetical protein